MAQVIRIPGAGEVIGGQYELGDEIGRGGFGVVFRARQLGVVERDVAIKMLLPHAMTTQGVVERFAREARLAASLSHPNSVVIYNHGLHQPSAEVTALPYIAMEYLDGETLQQYLARHKRLTVDDASEILMQALGSLGEAHTKGIIHRDIKPENIFLCNRNRAERVVKVLDFGIAKAVDGDWDPVVRERLTRTGLVAGTAEYMAPEQASGKKDLNAALDVYAMGCIAFQCLSGRVPYDGTSPMDIAIKHISNEVPPLPAPYNDAFIGQVIRRAMSKDPRERFTDANHFARVLHAGEMEAHALLFNAENTTLDEDSAGPPTVEVPTDSDVFTTVEVNQISSLEESRRLEASGHATVVVDAIDDEEPSPIPTSMVPAAAAAGYAAEDAPPRRSNATAFVVAGLLFLLFVIVGVGLAAYAMFVDSPNPPVAAIEPRVSPPAKPVNPAPAAVEAAVLPDAGDGEDGRTIEPAKEQPKEPAVAAADADAGVQEKDAGDLYDSVELQTNTNAKVYVNGKHVGSTPLSITQREFGTKPVKIELRSRGYRARTVSLDWTKGIITANLRPTRRTAAKDKTPPSADPGNSGRRGQTGKGSGSDGKTRKPAVFDPGKGPAKKPKKDPKLFN